MRREAVQRTLKKGADRQANIYLRLTSYSRTSAALVRELCRFNQRSKEWQMVFGRVKKASSLKSFVTKPKREQNPFERSAAAVVVRASCFF